MMTNRDETLAQLDETLRKTMVRYVQLHDAFGKGLAPHVGSPVGEKPFIAGSEDFNDLTRLMEEHDAAEAKYNQAWQQRLAYHTAQRGGYYA